MKKIQMMALAVAAILPSCTKDNEPEQTMDAGKVEIIINDEPMADHATITFGCSSTTMQSMTRATLSGLNLTDLWVFDGETLLKHQTSDDADFGSPTITANYGEHHFHFVASRGSEPTQNGTTIMWEKPSDTFWQNVILNVEPQTANSQAVSLQRVASRLRITITDEIPSTLSSLVVTPSHWYCGIDYTTGEAVDDRQTARTIIVPSSYAGTTGQLTASFFSISPSEAWTTDITLTAKASDNSTLSQISISDVPMQRNHITSYSGALFAAGRSISVEADDSWGDDISGMW